MYQNAFAQKGKITVSCTFSSMILLLTYRKMGHAQIDVGT
jgi:hypothetical protein